ncbi:hypothetical protein LCGC14_2123210 [marine sediment metagenome]|uniref:Peptidase C39-like domain-containing protein n=1 Tax=marine sediment metagenome TaxID=412755 RepID=A0A0F9E3P1_9ZZZZ
MNKLVTIDLSRFKKVKQEISDECIACCLESVLSYYGYKDKSKTDFYSILKPNLNFKGVMDKIAPLYPKLKFNFQNHNGDIIQLLDFVKNKLDNNIPIITAIKSDYNLQSVFQQKSLDQILLVVDIINPVAKSDKTHIITVIGYDDERVIFYEQGEQKYVSVNYDNSVFETIIQGGKYDTLIIFEK